MKEGGYLLIDHSASPGLPEEIARAAGYDPALCREGKRFESKTLTCAHCKTSVVPNHFRSRPRENCPKCGNHYICDVCAFQMTLPDYKHTPFEARRDGQRPFEQLGSPAKLLLP